MPLPPTVFVEDEEHNVVEAVRITHSQRILHHLDTVWWPLAERAAQFVRSGKFEAFIITCIMLNTIVLSIEHPFMDSRLELALCVANLVSWMCVCVCACEHDNRTKHRRTSRLDNASNLGTSPGWDIGLI